MTAEKDRGRAGLSVALNKRCLVPLTVTLGHFQRTCLKKEVCEKVFSNFFGIVIVMILLLLYIF